MQVVCTELAKPAQVTCWDKAGRVLELEYVPNQRTSTMNAGVHSQHTHNWMGQANSSTEYFMV